MYNRKKKERMNILLKLFPLELASKIFTLKVTGEGLTAQVISHSAEMKKQLVKLGLRFTISWENLLYQE